MFFTSIQQYFLISIFVAVILCLYNNQRKGFLFDVYTVCYSCLRNLGLSKVFLVFYDALIYFIYLFLYYYLGGVRITVVWRWTTGEHVERSILHKGHDSQQAGERIKEKGKWGQGLVQLEPVRCRVPQSTLLTMKKYFPVFRMVLPISLWLAQILRERTFWTPSSASTKFALCSADIRSLA